MKNLQVSKRWWTIVTVGFFTIGISAGLWMQLNSSPVETIDHTLELKHTWVQPLYLVFMVASMLIASVAIVRLRLRP